MLAKTKDLIPGMDLTRSTSMAQASLLEERGRSDTAGTVRVRHPSQPIAVNIATCDGQE